MWYLVGPMVVAPDGSIGIFNKMVAPDAETGEYTETPMQVYKQAVAEAQEQGFKLLSPDLIGSLSGNAGNADNGDEAVIASVMRRWQENKNQEDMTPCIDLFPPWNPEKTFGIYKITTVWLNTDEDKQAFNDATGLKWNELPVYGGESAVASTKRDPNRPSKFDISLPAPITIKVLKEPTGKMRDDGTPGIRTKFDGWKPRTPEPTE